MKPIALNVAVLALLCSTVASASQHSDACKRVQTAGDKLLYIVQNSYGANRGNAKILKGVIAQAKNDLDNGGNWAKKLAAINVDPQTGDPVDCGAIAAKHQAFLAAYPLILPKFDAAAQSCIDVSSAANGKCGAAVKAAFQARAEFIKSSLVPFVQAERAAPLYCQASYYGHVNGAALRSSGQPLEPCARPYYTGGPSICSGIPLNNMKNAADDACKNLHATGPPGKTKGIPGKIKTLFKKAFRRPAAETTPVLMAAKALCTPINRVRDDLNTLKLNPNSPNTGFFAASINAAVAREGLLDIKRAFCDGDSPVVSVDPD